MKTLIPVITQPRLSWLPLTIAILLAILLSSCAYLPSVSSPAIADLTKSANAGDTESQFQLGMRYASGTGVWQSDSVSMTWLEKAASQGHADAAYLVGIGYYTGQGVGQDYHQAARWFQRAADKGQARAQYQLAAAYMNGQGVPRDQAWGARWYGKAAYQGHSNAQFSLGVAFARGLGLPVHPVQACRWLLEAARSTQFDDRKRAVKDKVCNGLSLSQRQRATQLADRWTPRPVDLGYTDPPTIFYIQYRLSRLGYHPGHPDGYWGPMTEQAGNRFLRDAGVPQGVPKHW